MRRTALMYRLGRQSPPHFSGVRALDALAARLVGDGHLKHSARHAARAQTCRRSGCSIDQRVDI